jgi:large subunit ribosomal protein L32
MPNPKRRHSRHRKRIRRSHLALTATPANHCPRCGAATKSHCVCENCGHYGFEKGGSKGVEVLQREEPV